MPIPGLNRRGFPDDDGYNRLVDEILRLRGERKRAANETYRLAEAVVKAWEGAGLDQNRETLIRLIQDALE